MVRYLLSYPQIPWVCGSVDPETQRTRVCRPVDPEIQRTWPGGGARPSSRLHQSHNSTRTALDQRATPGDEAVL